MHTPIDRQVDEVNLKTHPRQLDRQKTGKSVGRDGGRKTIKETERRQTQYPSKETDRPTDNKQVKLKCEREGQRVKATLTELLGATNEFSTDRATDERMCVSGRGTKRSASVTLQT